MRRGFTGAIAAAASAALACAVVNTAYLRLGVTGSSPCPAAAIAVYAPAGTLTSHNATWAHWSAQRLGPVLDREAGSQCPFPAIGFDVTSAVTAAARAGGHGTITAQPSHTIATQ